MGWNQASEKELKKPEKKPSGVVKGAAAGVAVVLCAVVAWLYCRPSDQDAPKRQSGTAPAKRQIGEIKSQAKKVTVRPAATNLSVREENGVTNGLAAGIPTEWMGKKVVEGTLSTNDSGVIKIRMKTADGNWYRSVSHVKPWFNYSSDQVLVNYLSAKQGVDVPPIPMAGDMDKEFRESLKEEIVVNDDDKPEVKAMKRAVIEARESIRRQMEAGRSFREIIEEHIATTTENNKLYRDAVREYHEILRRGDKEGARKYRNVIGAALQQMGIKEFNPETHGERTEQHE